MGLHGMVLFNVSIELFSCREKAFPGEREVDQHLLGCCRGGSARLALVLRKEGAGAAESVSDPDQYPAELWVCVVSRALISLFNKSVFDTRHPS